LTAKLHSLHVKELESGVRVGNFGKIGVESESDILPPTPQPCSPGFLEANNTG